MKNLRENNSIFITGASGFLGKNFLNFLSKKKKFKNIYCLSRVKKKNFKNIKWIKGYLEDNFDKYLSKITRFGDDYERFFKYEINQTRKICLKMTKKLSKLYSLIKDINPQQ